jgi:hypothetical protein
MEIRPLNSFFSNRLITSIIKFYLSLGESDHISVAPWAGYQDEAVVKEKILSLSEDKRTFIRAPPSG